MLLISRVVSTSNWPKSYQGLLKELSQDDTLLWAHKPSIWSLWKNLFFILVGLEALVGYLTYLSGYRGKIF